MYFDKELTICLSSKNLLWEKEGYLNMTAFNLVKRTASCSVFFLDVSTVPCH